MDDSAAPTGANIMIATEKGGSRKTAIAAFLVGLALRQGYEVAAFEIEQRAELSLLFPGIATHIAMPATETVQQFDMAEIAALSPALSALSAPGDGLTVVDVGANLDSRLALCLAQTDMARRIADSGRQTSVIIPYFGEEASVGAAAKTAGRIQRALPEASLRFCRCETGGGANETMLLSIPDYKKVLHPLIVKHGEMRLPALSPTALSAMRAAGRSPFDFVDLAEEQIAAATGLNPFIAGTVRSKVLVYIDEVSRQMPDVFRK